MARPWYDTALVAYIAIFFVVELVMLQRTSRLGWAMSTKCAVFALLFVYALLSPFFPRVVDAGWPLTTLRFLVASALTWVVVELLWSRRR